MCTLKKFLCGEM